jgi:subtilisin family serine protease
MTTPLPLRRLTRASTLVAVLVMASAVPAAAQSSRPDFRQKTDAIVAQRALQQLAGTSRVLVEFNDKVDVRVFGRAPGKRVAANAYSTTIDNRKLFGLLSDRRVKRVMLDRPAFSTNERTNLSTGAALARLEHTLTGKNIGIAVIDSGYTSYHNDLFRTRTGWSPRLAHFHDFTLPTSGSVVVSQLTSDAYGHGTHVAGILAGNGYDSQGARAGIAPGAKIIALKVLDSQGQGYISDVIAAIDYAIARSAYYNIRIINLSVGAGVFESYANDPLAQAARRAVDAGIVVVTAAGNLGQNDEGETQFGGITSPGNAPWVLTVGAANHGGTGIRSDDDVAAFSSRGPTWINFTAKPDLLAYGVGIESLAAPGSTLAAELDEYLLDGSTAAVKPYLSLSGTSMSAPVVAGTIALMLEANPQLTPNAVKAILQYTAQVMPDAHALSQGAGLLNARGALRLATYFRTPTPDFPAPFDAIANETVKWAEHFIWGNYRVRGGVPLPGSNAWAPNQRWGDLSTPTGGAVIWGADDDANIVWSTSDDGNIVWSTSDADGNIVWSTDEDSNIVWSTGDDGNIVWSTIDDQDSNIVWSTAVAQNVVWGNDCGGRNCPKIVWGVARPKGAGVWGTLDDDGNIVWSTDDDGNSVWSTDDDGNIVWSTDDDGNIVWSTDDDGNIVWSTDDYDSNIVWSTDDDGNIVWSTDADGNIVWSTGDARGNIVGSTNEVHGIVWSNAAPQQLRWPAGD